MAGFIDRTEELLPLLGVTRRGLCRLLGLNESAYGQWKLGNLPERETLLLISNRLMVSIDSLMAMPGTDTLEPSPVLAKGQRLALDELLRRETPGSVLERLLLANRILTGVTPGLSVAAWAAYLQVTPGEWLAIEHGLERFGEPQIQGAAHLLGWYELKDAWLRWLRTGATDILKGPGEEFIKLNIKLGDQAGLIVADYMKARADQVAEKARKAK